VTIRNGQSRETDIDIHKKKTLKMVQSGMENPETMSLDCPFLIVTSLSLFLVYVNVSVSRLSIPDCPFSDTDIDIHKKKTLEIGQWGMENPETLTLTYKRKLSIRHCPISNVFFLCMSMSVSVDSQGMNCHTQQKKVRDRIIRNGQSKDTDIDIHKKKTLEKWQSGMDNPETLSYL
jgi:hypothetical protein